MQDLILQNSPEFPPSLFTGLDSVTYCSSDLGQDVVDHPLCSITSFGDGNACATRLFLRTDRIMFAEALALYPGR